MPIYDCTHESAEPAKLVCRHLLPVDENEYGKIFTGQASQHHLACLTCIKESDIAAIPWLTVCGACFAEIEAEGYYETFRGRPEIRTEPSRLTFTHRSVIIPGLGSDTLRLVQPIPQAPGNLWIGLTQSGVLIQFDLDNGTFLPTTEIAPTDLDREQAVSLDCSPDGAFACLTETLGNVGGVIECATGRRTLRLQREGYQSKYSPFPAAFIVHDGRTLLVHGSAWNRLDISDPATGSLLTERGPTSYRGGEQRPPHYLDYFHGSLTPSPHYDFIADNGWIWHPYGVVRTWNILRWLGENIWESEDGPTCKALTQRDYFWHGPLCWIDDRTLVVWGEGDDDQRMLPAARIFDVETGKETSMFSGPEQGWMAFDRYLFAISTQFGTSVWDHMKGARLYEDTSFAPTAFHPRTREFLSLLPSGAFQLSHLTEGDELR